MDVIDSKVALTLRTSFDSSMTSMLDSSGPLPSSSLRMQVESSSLALSVEFEEKLRVVVDRLKEVDECVQNIQGLSEGIVKSINDGNHEGNHEGNRDRNDGNESGGDGVGGTEVGSVETPAVLITRVLRERDEAVAKMNAVKAFLSKFQINDATEVALEPSSFSVSTGSKGGPEFLAALKEVTEARDNLSKAFDESAESDTATPNVGIQMLEKLADQQEMIYERLYEWIQGYLGINVPTSSDAVTKSDEEIDRAYGDEFVADAIATLENRPAFSEHVREMICNSRRAAVTRRFLHALGGEGGIELRANDPVGYVGDVLAWIHRTVAGEGEVINALFMDREDKVDILSVITSGVARPFKSRTLSVIENLAFSNDDVVEMDEPASRYKIVSLYSAYGVLQFYHVQLKKAAERCLGGGGEGGNGVKALLESITECLEEAAKTYDNSLKSHGESVKLFVGQGRMGWGRTASSSLLARDTIGSLAARIVDELTETNAMSPGFAATKTSSKELEEITSVEHIINCIFTPAVHLTDQIDDLLKLKGCLGDAKGVREECRSRWNDNVENKLDRLKEGLVDRVVKGIMEKVGLSAILALLDDLEGGKDMASVVGLEEATVANKIGVFYASLANFPIPDFEEDIDSARVRVELRNGVVGKVVDAYKRISDCVDHQGGYKEHAGWLLHTPTDVEALLSV